MIPIRLRASALAGVALAAALGLSSCGTGDPVAASGAPKVGHVFVLVLENENYATSFDPNGAAPYLAKTLPAMGQLLTQYYGTGHQSLDNYVTMVSGQAPNADTQSDCQVYSDFTGSSTTPDADGQVTGQGCVYPSTVKMVGDQLEAAGYSWRAYAEDMGNDLARDGATTCAHPAVGSQDPTQTASATDQYAMRHVPFLYFHTLIDDQPRCDAHVVPLTALENDLAGDTPNYVFITPNLCNDGHDPSTTDTVKACKNGDPGGLTNINAFLKSWIPKILASPAYQEDGLLIVTFDEASMSDTTACCGEKAGNNTTTPGATGAGGGRVGAVLVSRFIRPGTVNDTPYNHYSMLRSVEDIFGLPYLGYAGQAGLKAFGSDVFALP